MGTRPPIGKGGGGGVQVRRYSEHVHHCMQKKMIDTQDTMRRDVTS